MASLRNDPLGKGMAQILLAMPIRIPPGWDGVAGSAILESSPESTP